jgi:hypothetical protein
MYCILCIACYYWVSILSMIHPIPIYVGRDGCYLSVAGHNSDYHDGRRYTIPLPGERWLLSECSRP